MSTCSHDREVRADAFGLLVAHLAVQHPGTAADVRSYFATRPAGGSTPAHAAIVLALSRAEPSA